MHVGVHLAALPFIPESFSDPSSFFDVNTMGTVNVCRVAKEAGACRFVLISTSEVYRSAGADESLNEESQLDPLSPYANSKLGAEVALRSGAANSLPHVILRLFNAYGPRPTHAYFIPEMVRQCLYESVISVGRLDTFRDFTYVDDTASAIVLAASLPDVVGHTINIGSGQHRTMRTILECIQKMTDSAAKPVVIDASRQRPSGREPFCLVANPVNASVLLGWRPVIDLQEGLRRTINYIASRGRLPY